MTCWAVAFGLALSWGCAEGGNGPPARAPGTSAQAAATRPPNPVTLMQEMATTLGQAQALTFRAQRFVDPALTEGTNVPTTASIQVVVKRPNMLKATSLTSDNVRQFYFDGHSVVLYDQGRRFYAKTPMVGSIDQMIAALDNTFGFVPPVAEFTANRPFELIRQQVQAAQWVGLDTSNGTACDHIKVTGQLADADLWIGHSTHLPCALVATFTQIEGNPKLSITFAQWNLSAHPDDSLFHFDPPQNALEIRMVPLSEMEGTAVSTGELHRHRGAAVSTGERHRHGATGHHHRLAARARTADRRDREHVTRRHP